MSYFIIIAIVRWYTITIPYTLTRGFPSDHIERGSENPFFAQSKTCFFMNFYNLYLNNTLVGKIIKFDNIECKKKNPRI